MFNPIAFTLATPMAAGDSRTFDFATAYLLAAHGHQLQRTDGIQPGYPRYSGTEFTMTQVDEDTCRMAWTSAKSLPAGSYLLNLWLEEDGPGAVKLNAGRIRAAGGSVGGAAPAPTLLTLSLSGALQIGTEASGTINGATAGSTIVSNIPGITVDSSARTYSGTPTGSAATIANGLVETLAGATGSPKSSPITVGAAGVALSAFTMSGHALNYDNGATGRSMLAGAVAGSHVGYIQSPDAGVTWAITAQSVANLVSLVGNHLVAGAGAAGAAAGTPTVTIRGTKAGFSAVTQTINLRVNAAIVIPSPTALRLVAVGDSLVANSIGLASLTYAYRLSFSATRFSAARLLGRKFKMVQYQQPANVETDANGVKYYWGDYQGYSGGNAHLAYARQLLEGALAQQPGVLYYCFGTNYCAAGNDPAVSFAAIAADIDYARAARPSMPIIVGNLSAIGSPRTGSNDPDVFLALNAMINGGTYAGITYPGIASGRVGVTVLDNFGPTALNTGTLAGAGGKTWPANTTGLVDNFNVNGQRGSGAGGDGVHDGVGAAAIIGRALSTAVNALVQDGVDAFAENPNPNLLADDKAWAVGTTTTAVATTGTSGNVPATSSLKGSGLSTNTNLTSVLSVEANVDAGAPVNARKSVITLSPVAGTTSRNMAATFTSVTLSLAGQSGKTLQAAIYLEVSNSVGWEQIIAYLQLTGMTSDSYPTDGYAITTASIVGPGGAGMRLLQVVTPPFKVPPVGYKGWAGSNFQLTLSLNANPAVLLASGDTAIVAKIVKSDIREVVDPSLNPAP